MINVKICIPFYQDFEPAKSGLREIKSRCEPISCWVYQYDDYMFTIEPRQGTYPNGEVRNSYFGSNIAEVRNQFIKDQFDKYVFIDSDIIWTFDNLLKLLSHNNDIALAPYYGHSKDKIYMCGAWDRPGINHTHASIYSTGKRVVDWAGLGFIAISKEVFDTIEKPYFYCPMLTNEKKERMQLGEDMGFCINVMNKYTIMCDFDIMIKHKPRPVIDWSF